MNFLAIPTLKNERACFFSPISIKPSRGLKETFDRARMGMENVGSLERSAAVMTMSARPISFLSTTVVFLVLVAIRVLFLSLAACAAWTSRVSWHGLSVSWMRVREAPCDRLRYSAA